MAVIDDAYSFPVASQPMGSVFDCIPYFRTNPEHTTVFLLALAICILFLL